MSKRRNVSDMQIRALAQAGGTVNFAESFVSSEQFTLLFREGMGLVEETESMRLTTRLMQLASWLLLQRAVGEGELSRLQAERDKARITLKDVQAPSSSEALAPLPAGLLALISRSLRLQERICHLDGQITASLADTARPIVASDNPVNAQITMLRTALQSF